MMARRFVLATVLVCIGLTHNGSSLRTILGGLMTAAA